MHDINENYQIRKHLSIQIYTKWKWSLYGFHWLFSVKLSFSQDTETAARRSPAQITMAAGIDRFPEWLLPEACIWGLLIYSINLLLLYALFLIYTVWLEKKRAIVMIMSFGYN